MAQNPRTNNSDKIKKMESTDNKTGEKIIHKFYDYFERQGRKFYAIYLITDTRVDFLLLLKRHILQKTYL